MWKYITAKMDILEERLCLRQPTLQLQRSRWNVRSSYTHVHIMGLERCRVRYGLWVFLYAIVPNSAGDQYQHYECESHLVSLL